MVWSHRQSPTIQPPAVHAGQSMMSGRSSDLASSDCRAFPVLDQWIDAADVSLTALGTFRSLTEFPILPPETGTRRRVYAGKNRSMQSFTQRPGNNVHRRTHRLAATSWAR